MTRQGLEKHWDVIRAFKDGAEIEFMFEDGTWGNATTPTFDEDREFRIKSEFVYPLFYKSKFNGSIIKFVSLESGYVVEKGSTTLEVGEFSDRWLQHTDPIYWEQVEDPTMKPLLYEWWYSISHYCGYLFTEEEAKNFFNGTEGVTYGKTGRFFNPDTKEFNSI